MMLACSYAGLSDVGRVRSINEDRWVADPEAGLYLVADGMGGRVSGGLAATLVAETLPIQVRRRMAALNKATDESMKEVLKSSLSELCETLVEQTRGEIGIEGLGATVVVLLVQDGRGCVAHLGDSRAYLCRQGQVTRLTKDHTLIQTLVDREEFAPEVVANHPARNQLTRFIGMENPVLPDVHTFELESQDRVLLCSDGLSDMLNQTQLRETAGARIGPKEVCQRLIDAANNAGGADNITAVVVEVSNVAITDSNHSMRGD